MSIDRLVMAFAGIVILASVALSQVHHVYWLGLTASARWPSSSRRWARSRAKPSPDIRLSLNKCKSRPSNEGAGLLP